ncbi:MAG TPA: TonB-dependent receptor plug domain-containing protein [Opitutaceae bacterium]
MALGSGAAFAQQAPAPTPPPDNSTTSTPPPTTTTTTTTTTSNNSAEEQAILLNPFVVSSSDDQGYRATSTLAGTRVRTDLNDLASSISVVTGKELQDLGATGNEDLLVYTPSTEVAGLKGNFTGQAGNPIFTENTVNPSTRVRGLDSADNTRDYFITDIPWDSFDVDRVDLQRGPNSILFGVGSPAGIINTSPTDASFQQHFNVEQRTDEWGTLRESLNLNFVVIPDVLAVRIAALVENQKFEQVPAYNDQRRYYAAMRFDPKLFDEHSHTEIRAKYEWGQIRSNNPRQDPPVDELTPWFNTGTDAYGNPGFDKLTINQFSLTNANPSGKPMPGGDGSALASATYELGGNAETRSYWPDILNYYEATPVTRQNVASPIIPNGDPIKSIVAQANQGNSLNGNSSIGSIQYYRPYGIPDYSTYAAFVGTLGNGYPGNPIPGGAYYKDKVITDPSIFDFYTKLLDGPNKHEWQDWKAVNVALDQSFFDNRLAFEVALDHQEYDNGQDGWMNGQNYAISVDVNQTYADGTPNPNVGRPYVGNATSAPSLNFGINTLRNTIRFTPTVEIRPTDFISDRNIAGLIGNQTVTGLLERNEVTTFDDSWAEFATTPQYISDNANVGTNPALVNTLNSNREFDWIVYVGPSLTNAASAKGANLSNINYVVEPPVTQNVLNFNSTWKASTVPSNAAYVDPSATFTWTNFNDGTTGTGTQKDNPANYVGWSYEPVTWMSANNPSQFASLVESAERTKYKDDSEGFTYQGKLLNGDLVPTFGWRKDRITNYDTESQTDPNTGFTSLNFPDDPNSRTDVSGISRSWGVVYHFPRFIMDKLPFDTGFSVFFNDSENFKADAQRLNLEGLHIPNATGTTKEGGFTLSFLNDKITLKASYFKTLVDNATLSSTDGNSIGGLGSNGYFLADGLIWGYGWATALQDGLQGRTPNSTYWDYAAADGLPKTTPAELAAYNAYNTVGGTYTANGTTHTSIGGNAIVNAWLGLNLPSTYFSSFNLSPSINPTIGQKTGNLRDSYSTPQDDSSAPVPGGGSQFGNHQVTVDNLSEGEEIELYAQPIKNWDITINYSNVRASHSNVDQTAQTFIAYMTAFMNGPGGQLREWDNGGSAIGAQWNSSIVAPFTVLLNDQGHAAPEVSPWRLNLINTYKFDRNVFNGVLNNVFVGGGLRMEAGRILGYHFDPNYKNVNSANPDYSAVSFLTQGGLNVDEPFYGQMETHVDLWFGYNWKLSHNINWRIQVNLSNVGEKDRLIPAAVNPDGSVALARISEGTGWQLTNSFDF